MALGSVPYEFSDCSYSTVSKVLMQNGTNRSEDFPSLHEIAFLSQHSRDTISSIDVVLVLTQHSTEMLQSLEEAVVDLLHGLCSLGVTPAPCITPLGCVLVHMELTRFEVEHSLEQQGVGVMLTRRQLQHLVDVLLGLIKIFPV